MIRGTTPTHIFTLSMDTSLLKCIRIVYSQGDETILVKETADCTIDGNTISVALTQEETFLFDCKKLALIQIRALTLAGEVLATPIMKVEVEKCLDSEVIV